MLLEFDFSKLLGRMREKGESQRSLAAAIGMDKSTFNLKIRNRSEFTQCEIILICNKLSIPYAQIHLYFFQLKEVKKEAAPKSSLA